MKHIQSGGRIDQQTAIVHIGDLHHPDIFFFLRATVIAESIPVRIVIRKPVIRTYPYTSLIIGFDGIHHVVANASGIPGLVTIDGKIVSVETVYPIKRGKPHIALYVLGNAKHGALRQTVLQSDMGKRHLPPHPGASPNEAYDPCD